MSLTAGSVVRLEVDNGQLERSEHNSLVMYLVEENKQGQCGETCYCNCNNDCCSASSESDTSQEGFYEAPAGSGYRTGETSHTTPVIYITTPRSYYPTQPPPTPQTSRGSSGSYPGSYPDSYRGSSPGSSSGSSPGPCCRLVSVQLEDSVSARYQNSKAGQYRLVGGRGPGETTVVYRQERGDNYIFYLNHPAWSGWMVGPQVTSLLSLPQRNSSGGFF